MHQQRERAFATRGVNARLATASVAVGLVSLVIILAAPVAIGLGVVGLRRARVRPEVYGGSGLAVVGITLGCVGLLVGGVVWSIVMMRFAGR